MGTVVENIPTNFFALILEKSDDFDVTGNLVVKGLLHGNLFGEFFYDPWARKYVTFTSDERDSADVHGYFAFPVSREYLEYFDYKNEGEMAAFDTYFAAFSIGTFRLRYIPGEKREVMTVEYNSNPGEELVIDPLLSIDYANAGLVDLLEYQGRNKPVSKIKEISKGDLQQ